MKQFTSLEKLKPLDVVKVSLSVGLFSEEHFYKYLEDKGVGFFVDRGHNIVEVGECKRVGSLLEDKSLSLTY